MALGAYRSTADGAELENVLRHFNISQVGDAGPSATLEWVESKAEYLTQLELPDVCNCF